MLSFMSGRNIKFYLSCFLLASVSFFIPVFINLYGDFQSLITGRDVFYIATIHLCILVAILLLLLLNLFPILKFPFSARVVCSSSILFAVALSLYFAKDLVSLSDRIFFLINKQRFEDIASRDAAKPDRVVVVFTSTQGNLYRYFVSVDGVSLEDGWLDQRIVERIFRPSEYFAENYTCKFYSEHLQRDFYALNVSC